MGIGDCVVYVVGCKFFIDPKISYLPGLPIYIFEEILDISVELH